MTLSKIDMSRMCFLLGKHRFIGLSIEEKTELATLISIEVQGPKIKSNIIPFENTIKLGLIIVGMDILFNHAIMELYREQLCDRILKNLDTIDMNIQLENMGFFR